jgi:hypothetical protein
MARNAPAAEILTLSLPANPETGRIFRNQPCASRIQQLEGDSMTFDFGPWLGSADMVFVDGCHTDPHVRKDTESALQLRSPGGWVLWHDVEADCPDVIRALLDRRDEQIRWIRGTRYALLGTYRGPAGNAPGRVVVTPYVS